MGWDDSIGNPICIECVMKLQANELTALHKQAERAKKDIQRLRRVPYDTGPDGEPNGPDLGAYRDLEDQAERDKARIEDLQKLLHRTYAAWSREGWEKKGENLHDVLSDVAWDLYDRHDAPLKKEDPDPGIRP